MEASKDESYTHTTKLVTSGVYSVVRHPQFLAGVLITISMILVSQHPHSLIAGLIAAMTYASEVPAEDKRNIIKFGEPYKEYMREVPALNFVAGLLKRAM